MKHILLFLCLFLFSSILFAEKNNLDLENVDLEFCINQALSSHPKLQMTSFGIDKEKEKLTIAKAKYMPKLDASMSYNRLAYTPQSKQRYIGTGNDDYRAGIIASQPLFKSKERSADKNIAKFGVESMEQEYASIKEEVIFNVKTAYYKLLFAYDILDIKNEYFTHTKSFYDTAFDLNRRTKLPRQEILLRLSAQLNEIKQDIITAQSSIKISEKILVNAMGLDSSSQSIKIKKLKDIPDFKSGDKIDIAKTPDILKIDTEIKASVEAINLSKSSLYPQVKAYYNHAYEFGNFSNGDTDWTLGVVADFNIWDWGKTKAEIKQAKIRKSEIETYKDFVNKQLKLELESAQLEYESALKKYELALKALEQAKTSLDLFEKQYLSGLVTSLELLDSQKTFMQAQVNVATAKFEINIAKAKIEKIAGVGVRE